MAKSTVSLVKCAAYHGNDVENAVEQAFELADSIDVSGKSVFLKPNILGPYAPERAVTTHPTVVIAAIKAFKKRGAAKVMVGDSPALGNAEKSGIKSGIKKAVAGAGGQWVALSDNSEDRQTPDGSLHQRFTLCREALEADLIVSVAKLKTHMMTHFTGAMKNLFGLVPGLKKSRFHLNYPDRKDFGQMICDLNRTLKPAFAIMDAVIGMEGQGPSSGSPRQVGLIMASADILALDVTAARLIGLDPTQTPVLSDGLKSDRWINNPEEIDLAGASFEESQVPDFKKVKKVVDANSFKRYIPGPLFRFIRNLIAPRPIFDMKICVRCRRCEEICPAKVISFNGKDRKSFIDVDYNNCLRCYCCHEICPEKAIYVRNH